MVKCEICKKELVSNKALSQDFLKEIINEINIPEIFIRKIRGIKIIFGFWKFKIYNG